MLTPCACSLSVPVALTEQSEDSGEWVTWCVSCGAWDARRAVALLQPCWGPDRVQHSGMPRGVLSGTRRRRRRHPTTGAGLSRPMLVRGLGLPEAKGRRQARPRRRGQRSRQAQRA